MSEEKRPWINIDLSDAMLVLGIFALIILFAGKPDLWDVLLYRLSDGKVELPVTNEPKPEAP